MSSFLRLGPWLFLGAALASTGCVDESRSTPGAAGAVELALVLRPGLSLDSLDYALTGPSSFGRRGTFNLASSATFTATLGGLPAGTGYAITVTGTGTDGQTTCAGSASFDVTARVTTAVTLHVLCHEPAGPGGKVMGTMNACPVIDGLSAHPTEVAVGSSLVLTGNAHDNDSAPAALVYHWSATSGSIAGSGASASFTCTAPGAVTVTLTATDGACAQTAMIAVACSASAPDAGAPDAAASSDAAMVALEPWPGQNAVVSGDNLDQFGDNLSGLTYEPAAGGNPAVLWAALNAPGTIYRLIQSGGIWSFDGSHGWGAGKALHYPDGAGNPDSESVTRGEFTSPLVYVSTERNNDVGAVSRLSVLSFDSTAAGTSLTATHEWNVTGDLPAVGANLGLEGITWLPDSYLVTHQFFDEARGAAYDPTFYGDHAAGVFVVSVEATGILYGYVLDHATGAFHKVATIPSGLPAVMGLEFDRDTGALWTACDNTCMGAHNVLGLVNGKFVVRRSFARPSSLPDSNNEGIAIAPERECVGGFKRFFWADDAHLGGHALRSDSIRCGPLF
jgi:hypothetical protein